MAIAAQKTSRRACDAGFTLVEILCVLALLGLTAGLVVLNLPKPKPPIQSEVQILATTLNVAVRKSVIDGKVRAIDVDVGGIELFLYDGEWESETRRDFSEIARIDLEVEDHRVDLKARAKSKVELPPLIQFEPTGNVTPFTLSMSGRGGSFVLSPDLRGNITVEFQP